jgi:predicted pyridoxine 5'-phosphate oxidase superfamily flavin-nucleotide-binding protein
MSRAFSDLAFTPDVQAQQSRMGSRGAYARLDHAEDRRDALTARESEFIEQRDGFYQATVSQTGWPYVQFRGGPAGFLRVLDSRTLGYADLRGNLQYISLGNLTGDDRVAIILMDYARRRRLKLWARAKVVLPQEDPRLMAQLEMVDYRAVVQRGILLHIEAFDWNCPRHITPRFTREEIQLLLSE